VADLDPRKGGQPPPPPGAGLAHCRGAALAAGEPPGLEEARRICALPIERPLSPEEVEAVSQAELTLGALARGYRLWRQQAEVLNAFQGIGGAFVALGVGKGKALSSLLAAKHGWRTGAERILLMVPPRLITKSITRDIPQARELIGLETPKHAVGGQRPARRLALCRSRWRGIYVYPYSLLKEDQADEELALLDPDLVICDEVHRLANPNSGSAKRWLTMMRARRRRFVGLSGTMARKSLKNYAHIALLALGDKCFLPRQEGEVALWADVMSEDGREWKDEENKIDMRPLLEPVRLFALDAVRRGLVDPLSVGGTLTPDAPGFRRAYRVRRDCAPGVVASDETEVGCSLIISNLPASGLDDAAVRALERRLGDAHPEGELFVPREAFAAFPPLERLYALLWAVRKRATTPNGDQIQYAIHQPKWQYEISTGFYNELVWPTAQRLAQDWHIDEPQAVELLLRAKDHHEAQRKSDREMRYFLEGGHVPGLDMPMLVGNGCARRDPRLPPKLVKLWHEAKELDFEGKPGRVSRVDRVCDWKVRLAVDWASKLPAGKGALIWVYNVEVGEWAFEAAKASLGPGRVLYCPGGLRADREIQDPANADKIIVASMSSHMEGKDLQTMFSENFYLQWPRSANMAEQTLGRTHRYGQPDDEVNAVTCHSTEFDHLNYDACLRDAMFLHQTEGRQKIVYADYPDKPRIHNTEFLRQRGFADLLSKEDQAGALRVVLGIVEEREPD